MRLLAPALAAIRSTRAPASPWAANSCFAASRMRSRIPSGSRCHFRVFVVLAKLLARCTRPGVARAARFENEAICDPPSLRAKRSNPQHGTRVDGLLRRGACHRARMRATRWLLAMTRPRRSPLRRLLQQQGVDAAGAAPHARDPRARLAAGAHLRDF